MNIEIDQSGQITKTNIPTVFAFSNSKNYAIVIPSKVKKAITKHMKIHYQKINKPYLSLFAACVFLLIKDVIRSTHIIILEKNLKLIY
ncbi:MAG: hypothetical protein A2666_01170 [Parcubacteria group bacterium RIFCSPHIGHO2_01_FULL_47_10b]|nr:MAG: hypothetical protein A2666_01170 [Parcubacteria group bacterium RIFCSPHIGHO2_01_FULL_47_10b]